MKLSEVSDAVLLNYMRLDPEYASSEDKAFANACKSAAVFYVDRRPRRYNHCDIGACGRHV